MHTLNVLSWFTGLIVFFLIGASLIIALGWYIFSSICTIIFIRRIARRSNFKTKTGKPIPFKDYIREFRYWQHCTGQPYHITFTKTGEKLWMPWPYGTKKYRESVIAREQSEWDALGGDYGTSS